MLYEDVPDVIIINSLGEELPYGRRALIKCEVPSCMEYTHQYYSTCEKHTGMLARAGMPIKMAVQPMYVYNSPLPLGDTVYDFRFSASYAGRYHNCHGSANLTEAIPGFEYPPDRDDGMKAEGTKLHKIFEVALRKPERLRDTITLLREIAKLWGPDRTQYLKQTGMAYVTKWFLAHRSEPPLEIELLKETMYQRKQVINPDRTPKIVNGEEVWTETSVAPRRIEHLADAMEYVADLWDTLDPATREIFVEEKRKATWLETEPGTTVDLILRDKNIMHVLDLKMGDIKVSAINNTQLMYYGITFGAIDWDKVVLHIIQRKNVNQWTVPRAVLEQYRDDVRESERAILGGDLTLKAGNHCTFCPANPRSRGDRGNKVCPAMQEHLYGAKNRAEADATVVNDGDDYSE